MKVFKSCGLTALALIILLILIIVTGVLVFSRKYNSGMASLRAHGEPMTLAELQKDPVPDNQNAAPIYLSVSNELRGPRYSSYAEVLDAFSPTKIGNDPRAWQDVGGAVKATAPLFAEIERAASMPKCRFPQDWSSPSAMNLSYLSGSRRLARLCRARAVVSARGGDMSDAAHMVELQYRISESLYDEPTLIGYLVRIACTAVATQTLSDISACGRVSEFDAKRLYDLLATIDPDKAYVHALRGERAFCIRSWDVMPMTPSGATVPPVAGAVFYPDRSVYLRAMQEEINHAGMSSLEAKAKGLPDPVKRLPFYAVTTRMLLPIYTRSRSQRDAHLASVRGSQAFLAAIAFRDRYGVYPQSLAAAQSKLGWKLKGDPFSGKPFIYKRKGTGFLLYSIGEDMVDNGGIHGKTYQRPDMVWEMAR